MWLYFNKNGQILEMLEHGSPARVGATNFEIFAVFEDINIEVTYGNATLKLRKPDYKNVEYPALLMDRVDKTFNILENEKPVHFENGKTYSGYYFDFSDFGLGQDIEILLDTPGLWEAIITLIGASRRLNVQGVATFFVAGSNAQLNPTEISINSLLTRIYTTMGTKLNIASTRYMRVLESFDDYVIDGFPPDEFNVGDVIFNKSDDTFYVLNSLEYIEGVNPAYYEFKYSGAYFETIEVGTKIMLPSVESIQLLDGTHLNTLEQNDERYLKKSDYLSAIDIGDMFLDN